MKKKYATGVLWLLTFGVFGIGWIADTVIAFKNISKTENNEQIFGGGTRSFVKSFDTVIVGTFADCDLEKGEKREDWLAPVKPKWKLGLQYWEYKGKPAYYVLHPSGVDIGNLRAGLAEILHNEYSDCEFEVTAIKKTFDEYHDCMTFDIRIDIYR
jgi:hypothetical protein